AGRPRPDLARPKMRVDSLAVSVGKLTGSAVRLLIATSTVGRSATGTGGGPFTGAALRGDPKPASRLRMGAEHAREVGDGCVAAAEWVEPEAMLDGCEDRGGVVLGVVDCLLPPDEGRDNEGGD